MRVTTVFATCDDDFPCTEGRELRGELVVVDHETWKAQVVAGTMLSGAADLRELKECCEQAAQLIEREGGG